jgi:hypothetical protein
MTTYQEERAAFIKVAADNGIDLQDATSILRAATTLERIATAQCNRDLTRREERQDAAAERRVERICEKYPGVTPDFSGDPRGYTLKLHLPNGQYNTWGGAPVGYGVPSSYREAIWR